MKIAAIIQARMGSSRLPGKVMMKLDEYPTLYHVVNQLRVSKFLDEIIIATSTEKQDDLIFEYAKKNHLLVFRGDEKDCLDRYYQCAKKFNVDIIVRIPADKPLIDPNLVDDLLEKFLKTKYDYASNWLTKNVPSGTEVEAVTFNALSKSWKEAISQNNREHVTQYIYENPNKFSILNLKYNDMPINLKYSLDTPEDLIFIKQVFDEIKKRPIFTDDIKKKFSN